MSYRFFATTGFAALAFAVTVPAAASSDGFVDVRGEAGSQFVGAPSTKSRAEVRAELLAVPHASWRLTEASPPPEIATQRTAFGPTREEIRQAAALATQAKPTDGWRDLGGEAGWTFEN